VSQRPSDTSFACAGEMDRRVSGRTRIADGQGAPAADRFSPRRQHQVQVSGLCRAQAISAGSARARTQLSVAAAAPRSLGEQHSQWPLRPRLHNEQAPAAADSNLLKEQDLLRAATQRIPRKLGALDGSALARRIPRAWKPELMEQRIASVCAAGVSQDARRIGRMPVGQSLAEFAPASSVPRWTVDSHTREHFRPNNDAKAHHRRKCSLCRNPTNPYARSFFFFKMIHKLRKL
jgi:hypothetical protein